MNVTQESLDILYEMFRFTFLDPYIIKHHPRLFTLASAIYNTIYIEPYQQSIVLEEIPIKTLLQLEEEFLLSLKKEYKDLFVKDYKEGKIIRIRNQNGDGTYRKILFLEKYEVEFPEQNNLDSLIALTHEYLHALSDKFPKRKEETSAYEVYTEMLSFLGELKHLDFLEKKLIPHEKIELYKQSYIKRLKAKFDAFLFTEPLLSVYHENKNFKINHIEDLIENNPYYKTLGRKKVEKRIIAITRKCNIDRLEQDIEEYRYILGIARTCHLHQNKISNKEFVKLIEKINEVEVDEFEKMLPMISDTDLVKAAQKEFVLKK